MLKLFNLYIYVQFFVEDLYFAIFFHDIIKNIVIIILCFSFFLSFFLFFFFKKPTIIYFQRIFSFIYIKNTSSIYYSTSKNLILKIHQKPETEKKCEQQKLKVFLTKYSLNKKYKIIYKYKIDS